MSVSSNPASFLRRAKKVSVPECVMAKFLMLKPDRAIIWVPNGNSKTAHNIVASYRTEETFEHNGSKLYKSIKLIRKYEDHKEVFRIVRDMGLLNTETIIEVVIP